MKLPKIVILSLIFACIGITTEVFFTAISNVVTSILSQSEIDWSLTGKTYIWMVFIYGLIPFLIKALNPIFSKFHLLIKALIAVFIIFIVEFVSGWLLEVITGACPWKYTEGLHVCGFIRLDYFPFWYVFALLILTIYQSLNERLK